jgi:hypothetical protein
MGQRPCFPPDVSGWEYGPAWLDTNTAVARFGMVSSLLAAQPDDQRDVPGETPQQAYDRAYQLVGQPWLAPATIAGIQAYAASAPSGTATQRRIRLRVLRALMLGGPDGQVM